MRYPDGDRQIGEPRYSNSLWVRWTNSWNARYSPTPPSLKGRTWNSLMVGSNSLTNGTGLLLVSWGWEEPLRGRMDLHFALPPRDENSPRP